MITCAVPCAMCDAAGVPTFASVTAPSRLPSSLSPVRSSELRAARDHLLTGGRVPPLVLRGELGSGRTVLLGRLVGAAREAGYDVRPLPSLGVQRLEELLPVTAPTLLVHDRDDVLDTGADELLAPLAWQVSAQPLVRLVAVTAGGEDDGLCEVLDVAPLPEAEAHDLVARRAPEAAPTFVDRVVELAEGNVALLVEGARQLRGGGVCGPAGLEAIELPGQYAALAERFTTSGPAAQQLLAGAAVRRGDIALGRADQGVGGFLRHVGGGRYRFRTPVHRAAVLAASSSELLRLSHTLAASDPSLPPHLRAWHDARRRQDDGTSLSTWADTASYASPSSVVLAHLAAAEAADRADHEAQATRRRGQALAAAALSGDLVLAERLVAGGRTDLQADPEAMVGAALVRGLGQGDLAGARELLMRAAAGGREPRTTELALVALAVLNVHDHEAEWWRQWAVLAEACPTAVVRRLGTAVGSATGEQPGPRAVPFDRPLAPRSFVDDLAEGLVGAVLPEESWQVAAASSGHGTGSRLAQALSELVRAVRAMRDGAWPEALVLIEAGGRLARSSAARALTLGADAMRAMSLAFTGRDDDARSLALQVLADPVTARCPRVAAMARHVLLHLALQAGDGDAVLVAVTDADHLAFDGGAHPAAWMLDLADGLEHPEVPTHLRAARESLLSPSVRRRSAAERTAHDYLRAMGAGPGRLVELRRIVAGTRGHSFTFEAARVRLGYARLLAASGEVDEARALLTSAVAAFSALGAHGWAALAGELLADLEQRAEMERVIGAELAAPVVDAELTEQERKVAALAAAGLSNKEIGERLYLSPRTVGGHLYNVFPKLGVRSRAGLRDALNRSRDGRLASAS